MQVSTRKNLREYVIDFLLARYPHIQWFRLSYLSTTCLHGRCGYCEAPTVTRDGEWAVLGPSHGAERDASKHPAQCKGCRDQCKCFRRACPHGPQARRAARRQARQERRQAAQS